ncbi:amino acid permease [Caldinitratiruptor microaerophilus]|uniref:Amino acid permease n=1 Tax=Caldinitratiruptor microaerophilus TaxID=671077 RepID=A0AA35CKB5_9FIRM|nr:amino acid permease [Caldinitratiruptor microaerophilus]BDG59993.1 amino acid permease [Caldinitratiruptor microaerophilus]
MGLLRELFRTRNPEPAPAEGAGLRRVLGWVDLSVLGIGAVIGTGIFVLTGVGAARYAGPGVTLSFLLAGLVAGLAALVYAELAAMVPVSGSAYTFAYAALGEIVAWVIGWNMILEYAVAGGAVAIGWGSYLVDLLRAAGVTLRPALTEPPPAGLVNLPAMLVSVAVTALVALGTRESARANRVMVGLKLAVVLLFLAVGIRFVDPANWRPLLPFGWAGVARGAAIIFFAYVGFDAVATAAEEVRSPERDVPRGILGALVVATSLYLAVSLVLTGMVPYPRLDTASPVAMALLAHGQRLAAGVVSAGAEVGLLSVLIAVTFAQSRIFFSMSRDGLLPPIFSRVHPRTGTPLAGTLLTGAVAVVIGGFLPISVVAELANIGTLSAFVAVGLGVWVLRRTRPEARRPFRTPGMPWTALGVVVSSLYLMSRLPVLTWTRFGVWLAIGLAVYFAYGRRHSLLARPARAPREPRAPAAPAEPVQGDGVPAWTPPVPPAAPGPAPEPARASWAPPADAAGPGGAPTGHPPGP